MNDERITQTSLARVYEPRLVMSDGALDRFIHAVEAVKEAVSVKEYLRGQGVEVRHNRARCIVHDGDNPQSFAVYPERRRWYCFKCHRGGDVIDLCQVVEDHSEIWTAVVAVATQYGVELPGRPESWYRRQKEKRPVEDCILEALADTYQRRFFRVFGDLALENIEDETEREVEARRLHKGFRPAAEAAARKRWERRCG